MLPYRLPALTRGEPSGTGEEQRDAGAAGPRWAVVQYALAPAAIERLVSGVDAATGGDPTSLAATVFRDEASRVARDLARHVPCHVVGRLRYAPLLLLAPERPGTLATWESAPDVLGVSSWPGAPPPRFSLPPPRPDDEPSLLAMIERGRPDPRHPGIAARAARAFVAGDASVQPHPTRVLAALLEHNPTSVLCLAVPRGARQWAWLAAIDHVLDCGVRVVNLSFGVPEAELSRGWDRLEPMLEIFSAVTGACFVAAAGNRSPSEPAAASVCLPARHPAVLAVAGVVPTGTGESWTGFAGNRLARNAETELCASAVDPTGGLPGTSFAAARVSSLIAAIVRRRPQARPALCRALALMSARPPARDPHGSLDAAGRIGRTLGLGMPDAALAWRCLEAGRFRTGRGSETVDLQSSNDGARRVRAVLCWPPRATADLLRSGDAAAPVGMRLFLEGAPSIGARSGGTPSMPTDDGMAAWQLAVGETTALRIEAPPAATWALAWREED